MLSGFYLLHESGIACDSVALPLDRISYTESCFINDISALFPLLMEDYVTKAQLIAL